MFKSDSLILVVDDTESARQIVKNHLEGLGFSDIITGADGIEALNHLKSCESLQTKVDLIISDWMMPNMSGLELLQEVRGNPATAKIPFLMVTAESDTLQIVKAIQLGVSDYIIKPFDSQTLFKKLTVISNKLKPKG